MRVAIVHDFLNQRGGAERAVVSLSRIFPDAPIFTSVYDPDGTFDEFRSLDVRTTFLQRLPHSEAQFRSLLPLYPLAFRKIDLRGYDLVISSSTHWAHHVDPRRAHHVVYCYNPPRWLYQTSEYLTDGGPTPSWASKALVPLLALLRKLDQAAAARPDAYIAISQLVSQRISKTYGREAEVVYPPIDLDRFMGVAPSGGKGGDHYLVVSRLLPYKRVDLAVEVCTQRKVPLIVVGDGPSLADLRRLAGPNVSFVGKVGDDELLQLYARARALIHCGQEDFGLVPLEANAAGIPAVVFRNGGALETVIDGVTGILFPEQQGGILNQALDQVESTSWDADALRRHAARFDERSFELNLLRALEKSIGRAAK